MRQRALVAATAAILAIIIWWPFDFSLSAVDTTLSRLRLGLAQSPGAYDAVINTLAFVPLGLLAARGTLRSLARVAYIAFALSLTLELGQVFMPGRVLSVWDVSFNVAGALAGGLIAVGTPKLLCTIRGIRIGATWWALIGASAGVVAFTWMQANFVSMHNWSIDQTLQIGNEATGDRPWCGDVLQFAISIKEEVWTEKSFALRKRPWGEQSSGIDCRSDGWWQAVGGSRELNEAVRKSGTIRLQVLARPATTDQRGPARILSISRDPGHRNLTIGQESRDLVVRIRRRWAGSNGTRPYYRISNVFEERQPTWIIVDVNSDSTTVIAGGKRVTNRHDIARQWWILLLPGYRWNSVPLGTPAAFLYWAIVLGLFGLITGSASVGERKSLWLTATICGIPSVIGWFLIRIATDAGIGWESLIAMPTAMIGSAILARGNRST